MDTEREVSVSVPILEPDTGERVKKRRVPVRDSEDAYVYIYAEIEKEEMVLIRLTPGFSFSRKRVLRAGIRRYVLVTLVGLKLKTRGC